MDSVLSALNENIQEGDKHAEVLYEQMDQTFISATKYLADLTNILKKLINIFQLEHLSLSHFKSQLDTTLKAIQTEFIGSEETQYIDRIEFSKIIDKEKLKQEWDLVKYYLWTYKNNNEEMDFIQLWKHILDTDEDFSFNYPTISLILKIALIIPLSNAQVERIFSQQNLIKNNMRNKMSIDTLSNHLMILLNGPEIEDFDFEKAYKHWEGKKIRRSNRSEEHTS